MSAENIVSSIRLIPEGRFRSPSMPRLLGAEISQSLLRIEREAFTNREVPRWDTLQVRTSHEESPVPALLLSTSVNTRPMLSIHDLLAAADDRRND